MRRSAPSRVVQSRRIDKRTWARTLIGGELRSRADATARVFYRVTRMPAAGSFPAPNAGAPKALTTSSFPGKANYQHRTNQQPGHAGGFPAVVMSFEHTEGYR
jgi:hypothetical protein